MGGAGQCRHRRNAPRQLDSVVALWRLPLHLLCRVPGHASRAHRHAGYGVPHHHGLSVRAWLRLEHLPHARPGTHPAKDPPGRGLVYDGHGLHLHCHGVRVHPRWAKLSGLLHRSAHDEHWRGAAHLPGPGHMVFHGHPVRARSDVEGDAHDVHDVLLLHGLRAHRLQLAAQDDHRGHAPGEGAGQLDFFLLHPRHGLYQSGSRLQ
mmetsp:Transcript_15713/g.38511  ORF Transcript_15713/g.38511 Transcript_15713/m.38511 type:complete len:206 (+) Transcript_15713:91-708(+)